MLTAARLEVLLTSLNTLPQHPFLLLRYLVHVGYNCCGGRYAGKGSWQGCSSDKAARKQVHVLSGKHKYKG